jgi:outer membrane protein assembly factor BamA
MRASQVRPVRLVRQVRRGAPLALFVLLACFGGARPAAAQDPLDAVLGKTVTDVRIEVEGQPSTIAALRQVVSVTVGQPLRQQDLSATIRGLASLEAFDAERTEVLADTTAAGVAIIFRLWPRHPLNRIEVTGATGLPPDVLNQRVLDQFGRILPIGLSQERVRATVERVLRDEGYLRAAVTKVETVQTHEEHRATLIATVDAGPRAIISKTDVTGQSPFTAAVIQDRTATRPGLPFREADVRERLAALRADLGNLGYYAAETRIADRLPSEDGATIAITLGVNAGPKVDIRWDRSADPPPGDLDTLVPVRQEGSIDIDLLDQGKQNLEDTLKRDGYWKAEVSYTKGEGDPLVITYRIVRGRRFLIERTELPAAPQVPLALLEKLLEIRHGDVLDNGKVMQGIQRVIDEYRRRGFYRMGVDPRYEELPDRETATTAWVVVHPRIVEGPLGTITGIQFAFADATHAPEAALRGVMRLRAGAPYVNADRLFDEEALRRFYDARGHTSARVEIAPPPLNGGADVGLTVSIVEGPRSIVGDILVFGRTKVGEASILEDLTFKVGDPLSRHSLDESERALQDRGIFRRARITAEPTLPGESRARVIVQVEESPATTLGYGGGVEVGTIRRLRADGTSENSLEASPRGFFQITRRNIGGRNRLLSLFSRLSLKPAPELDGRRFGFAEYRVAGTFQETRAFRSETDVLLSLSSEQAVRTNFNYVRRGFSAEALRHVSTTVAVTGRYALDFTRRFDDRVPPDQLPNTDRLFPQVRLSTLSAGVQWDRRDNPITAASGFLTTAEVETAMRAIGSEVGYFKTFVQLARYAALRDDGRVVAAGRIQIGAARGFSRTVETVDQFGNAVVDIVEDLPASQRFYAGGGTTVRGYQLDLLGVPEVIDPLSGFSRGGNGLVIMNAELRAVVGSLFGRPLAAVGFIDAGNVFHRAGDIDLRRLNGTPGFGVRYDSPVGPIRFDIGFQLTRFEYGTRRDRGYEFHLSIGEAF